MEEEEYCREREGEGVKKREGRVMPGRA